MKQVIAAVAATVAFSASALTFESGEVYSNGEVVHVSETAIGQKQIEENGYVVVGNNVVLDISDAGVGVETATVSIQDAIAGGDKLVEAIGADISSEIAGAIERGDISEDLGNQLSTLDASQFEDVANAIETEAVDLAQLEEISSILQDNDVGLKDFLETSSYEDAVSKFGQDVADQIKATATDGDITVNAAGQPIQ